MTDLADRASTAAPVTLTAAEQAVLARAAMALARMHAPAFPWPGQGGGRIRAAEADLTEGLDVWARLVTGRSEPAQVFSQLARGWPDDALGQALTWAVADINDDIAGLVAAVAHACGPAVGRWIEHGGDLEPERD